MTDQASFLTRSLDGLRARLLDLTTRNPLVDFKHSARSRRFVRVIDELPGELYERLESGSTMPFKSLPEPASDPPDERTIEFKRALDQARLEDEAYRRELDDLGDDPGDKAIVAAEMRMRTRLRERLGMPPRREQAQVSPAEIALRLGLNPAFDLPEPSSDGPRPSRHTDSAMQTLLFPEALDRTLSRVFAQVRHGLDEMGVNTLYAAFGFLEWYEDTNSQRPLHAPLLLYPLGIQRELARGRYHFVVSTLGESAEVNVTLAERLKRDFSLELPPFRDGATPEEYLGEVNGLICDRASWKVRRWVTIGLFSFARIAMYKDLAPSSWMTGASLESSDNIRRLLVGGERSTGEPESAQDVSAVTFAQDLDVEEAERSARAPQLIADADSSQVSVVIDVLQGRDLVVEGPPGTGKSQTITNVIAAALQAQKTVLFVAEKMAALNVVKKRLEDAGLGQFCLELHSTKAGRRDTIEALERRLQFIASPPGQVVAAQGKLESLRDALSSYSAALNASAGALQMSVQEVLWAAQRIREEEPDLPAELDDVRLPDAEQIGRLEADAREDALSVLARQRQAILDVHGSLLRHPWWGVANPEMDPFAAEDVVRRVRVLSEAVGAVEESAKELSRITGIHEPWTIDGLELIVSAVEALPAWQSELDADLLAKLADGTARSRLRLFTQDCRKLAEADARLARAFTDHTSVPRAAPERLRELAGLARDLAVESLRASEVPNLVRSSLEEASQKRSLARASSDLASRFGLSAEQTRAMVEAMSNAIMLAANAPTEMIDAREPGLLDRQALGRVVQLEACALALSERRKALSAEFTLASVPGPDECLVHAFALKNKPLLPFLSKRFRKARATYRAMCRQNSKVVSNQMAMAFDALAAYGRELPAFEGDSELASTLGPLNRGLASNFVVARAVATWADRVRAVLGSANAAGEQVRDVLFTCAADEFDRLRATGASDLPVRMQGFVGSASEATVQAVASSAEDCSGKTLVLERLTKELQLREDFCLGDSSNVAGTLLAEHELHERLSRDSAVSALLGERFAGAETNPELLELVTSLAESYSGSALPRSLVTWLLTPGVTERLEMLVRASQGLAQSVRAFRTTEAAFLELARPRCRVWLGYDRLSETQPSELRAHLDKCWQQPDGLYALIDDQRSERQAREAGLGGLLDVFQNGGRAWTKLPVAFRRVLYSSCARAAVVREPALSRFVGVTHDAARAQYQALDRSLLDLRRKRLASELARRSVDPGNGVGPRGTWTGYALISNEVIKKRRHIAIRDLMDRAGLAVQQLMPCFMMSPLSIAQYLKPGNLSFDLLIMDEASQMRPEDAIGGIARARQLLIVGDPKQLPPTSFFETSADGMTVEGEESGADEESVLDAALQTIRPARRLKWHYRSRHGSLIAFSNRAFYDDELVVFPSPSENGDDVGVSYVHVADGCYRPGVGINPPEVERVVNEAIELMQSRPHRSLGIVTMNKAQQELLSRRLDERIASDPAAAAYVKRWEGTLEPYFVKNLENVQGDERDVIFISTVYGRDESGNVYQRFGPITHAGGHRRLNVLYTRAKFQTVVYSSMDPADIRVEGTSSQGVKALQGFLQYAKYRHLETPMFSGREPDSDFEICVQRTLLAEGYEVVPQVGVAGYFIDLAVRHPKRLGEFALAIECDGATYHSAKCTRDRDRLRQEVLERLGWRVHRIWSLDWFRNARAERQRLLEAVKRAVES